MFEEYFSKEIDLVHKAFNAQDTATLTELVVPCLETISQQKALYIDFVIDRFFDILIYDYANLDINKKTG